MKRVLSVMLLCGVWVSFGCGKPEEPVTPTPATPADPVPTAEGSPGTASAVPAAPPAQWVDPKPNPAKQWPRPERAEVEAVVVDTSTPEAVVEQLSKALSEGRYQALWEALPEKHQAELTGLVVEFTERVDPAVYDQIVILFEMSTKSLEKHKERFFAHPISSELPVEKEKLEKAWDPMIAFGKALLDSELYDLGELHRIDIGSFFATTVPRLVDTLPGLMALEIIPMDQAQEYFGFVESLKNAKATRVSEADGKVLVQIESEGHDPHEVEFVQVDGKWIPSKLEEEWPSLMESLREFLALVPDKNNKPENQKMAGNLLVPSVILSGIFNANTDEAFDSNMKAIQKLMAKYLKEEGGEEEAKDPAGEEKDGEAEKKDGGEAEAPESE